MHNVPPLPAMPNVPIVGLPCSVAGFTGPQVTIICSCEARVILMINGLGIPVQCPGCKRGRKLTIFNADSATHQVTIRVEDCPFEENK